MDMLYTKGAIDSSKFNQEKRELIDKSKENKALNINEVYGEDISHLVYNKAEDEEYEYKLSAIVLVYNGERYLYPCLESLVNQTLDGLEIILMNDASTDDSLSICKEFAMKYDNVRIIDKKDNHGLATSANMGIKIARGEYVILVDNDDIIPDYAYEKLYNKAKEVDADISIGKANLLIGNWQNEINDYERNVWEKERVIHDLSEFPTLFHDAFYWNKIMRKSLLIDNNIELPMGMIYADRKFAHTAYIHAKTISIIPDCVYEWRIRKNDKNDESLSMKRKEAWNYINRIDSYEIELDKIKEAYPEYFKILMRRVIVPIKGISESEEFKDAFYERGVKILKEECSLFENPYDNGLKNIENIYLYLILNDHFTKLEELLRADLKDFKEIHNENGKSYWKLGLFRDPELQIPDEIFEIKHIIPQFIEIDAIEAKEDYVYFKGIRLPKYLESEKVEIVFVGRTREYEVLKENSIYLEANRISDDNVYELKVDADELDSFEIYDIFFKVHYNESSEKFRVNNREINEISNESEALFISLTANNNLSISSAYFDRKFDIEMKKEGMKLDIKNDKAIKKDLGIYLRNRRTKEKTYFDLNEDDNYYFLDWKFFLDENSTYDLCLDIFDENNLIKKMIKFKKDYLIGFKDADFKVSGMSLKLYENQDGNISLVSK